MCFLVLLTAKYCFLSGYKAYLKPLILTDIDQNPWTNHSFQFLADNHMIQIYNNEYIQACYHETKFINKYTNKYETDHLNWNIDNASCLDGVFCFIFCSLGNTFQSRRVSSAPADITNVSSGLMVICNTLLVCPDRSATFFIDGYFQTDSWFCE